MKNRTIIGIIIAGVLNACSTPASHIQSTAGLQKTYSRFSHFSQVRLLPVVLPKALNKFTASKKLATHFDRELVIRLAKGLTKQKIAPTNYDTAARMLNIRPRFIPDQKSLLLEVAFQDNATGKILHMEKFNVPNTWHRGFKNIEMDRIRLTELASQVVHFIIQSQ